MQAKSFIPFTLRAFSTAWVPISVLALLTSCGLQVGTANYISEGNSAANSAAFKAVASDASAGRSLPFSVLPANPGEETLTGPSESAKKIYPVGTGQTVVSTARAMAGTPYRSGGATPQRGFDCSGLIYWVYQQHGITVPRVAKDQAFHGLKVHAGALKPGDIVAFRIRKDYHTGIYTGGGKFIHSPKPGTKVREETLNTNYWSGKFVSGRRIL